MDEPPRIFQGNHGTRTRHHYGLEKNNPERPIGAFRPEPADEGQSLRRPLATRIDKDPVSGDLTRSTTKKRPGRMLRRRRKRETERESASRFIPGVSDFRPDIADSAGIA